jgi:hypothetical protein
MSNKENIRTNISKIYYTKTAASTAVIFLFHVEQQLCNFFVGGILYFERFK